MWKSFLNRVQEKFSSENRGEKKLSGQLMAMAIVEMESSIAATHEALTIAIGNQKGLEQKAEAQLVEIKNCQLNVLKTIQSGSERDGILALEEKNKAEKVYEHYNNLAKQAALLIQDLKMRLDELKAKLVEAKAKEQLEAAEKLNPVELISKSVKEEEKEIVSSPIFIAFDTIEEKAHLDQENIEICTEKWKDIQSFFNEPAKPNEHKNEFNRLKIRLLEKDSPFKMNLNDKIATFFDETSQTIGDKEKPNWDLFFSNGPNGLGNEKQKLIDEFFNE